MSFPLALHSVSYAGVWPGQARLSLEDFFQRAKSLGFDAVMLMAKRPHLSPLDHNLESCGQIRQYLDKLGLRVACLAGYNDFCQAADRPDIPTREMQLLYIRDLCRMAHELDCNLVRVFTGFGTPHLSPQQQWDNCVQALREAAGHFAAPYGITIGVQNHHDVAVHHDSLFDLLQEIDLPNCKAMFDAWSPALQGIDIAAAVKEMAPYIVHTTVADYVRRPRFRYEPALVNYSREPDAIRAVPMGEGFIDYRSFFQALREMGYSGYVAYEMCSPLRGGGSEDNLDCCAKQFVRYLKEL
ncbi:MAG TPA: sugar phosphate isomerase/epimerase family protein [Gemmataceae bacterium]|nr:sugar phosphate isomerase/epimerase family protein [Gemmataceae bacterium]